MAAFCTKCGASVPDGMAFCSACGAPVASAATPVASTPVAYVPPASSAPAAGGYAQPVAVAAPAGGSSALKIILIIVAVFVGIGVLVVAGIGFTIWRVSKTVHVSDSGKGVSVSVPGGGSYSAGNITVTASDLGVDIYPGAAQQQGAVRVSTPNGTAITAVYQTSDPMDKVVDFYKDKLGTGASVYQSDKSAMLSRADEDKKDNVIVTITAESNSQTKIAIMHSKSS